MTLDLFAAAPWRVVPARRRSGTVTRLLVGDGSDFQTRDTPTLTLGFDGIEGDMHAGITRRSGAREPWYPRGTEMRNERQISVLSVAELDEIAERMGIDRLLPEWIGGNLLLDGLPKLSMIPPRTRLAFAGGAVLRVDGQNVPCRHAGRAIASHCPGREGLDLLFPKVAARLRGLVAWVEKPGVIAAGEAVTANIPEQWIYAD